MSANFVAPGAQQKRFAAYLDRLAQAAGHLDRTVPLTSYCTGLLLPGERKSVEPMAARLCPDKVRPISRCTMSWPIRPGGMKTFWKRCASTCCPPCGSKDRSKLGIIDDTGLVKR